MPRQPSLTFLRSQSDERLVRLAREGHERAFEAIVERYRKGLHRCCRRLLPEARAEDALQLALLAAWTALLRGDDVRELRPWLYQIVHRTGLNALRSSGYDYDELAESLEPATGTDEDLERRAIVREALAAMAALPERQREALLRTVGGASQREVARDLGLSTGAVRQLVHRARARLRAAATALTPLPLAAWLATAGTRAEPMAQRVGELAAGGAGAGAAAAMAKAGAVAVVAGSVIAGPGLVSHEPPHAVRAPAAERRPAPKRAVGPATAPVRVASSVTRPAPADPPRRRRTQRASAETVVRRAEAPREAERSATQRRRDDREAVERDDSEASQREQPRRDGGGQEDGPERVTRPAGEAPDGHDDGGDAAEPATASGGEHERGED